MADYRVYILSFDGHIRWADDIEAEDDMAAVRLARQRHENEELELWCGKRKVASVPKVGPIILPATPASSAS